LMIIFDIYADYAIDISDYAASWLSHYAEGWYYRRRLYWPAFDISCRRQILRYYWIAYISFQAISFQQLSFRFSARVSVFAWARQLFRAGALSLKPEPPL
jgi:hypothetical protein